MCLSCEIHDKWPPFIEFVVWFLLQGVSVGNHFAVWVVLQSEIIDITNSTYRNVTYFNANLTNTNLTNALMPLVTNASSILLNTSPPTTSTSSFNLTANNTNSPNNTNNNTVTCLDWHEMSILKRASLNMTNMTCLELYQTSEQQWGTLLDFREILLVFCIVGATLYVMHIVVLFPNIIQSCRVSDPIMLKDTGNIYFRSRLKVHALMLVMETIVFDIPVGCLTMEILSLIWEGPLNEAENMNASVLILKLTLIGLAFIALYKGMMPLFLWIGNPFCFPCIPLRLLIVFPGGLIALVMTFGPVMGVAKNRLLQFAPEVIQGEIGGLASTFFSIGMIFWGIFLIVLVVGGCCWYKVCREGADGNVCSICC